MLKPSQKAGSLYSEYLLGITTLNVDQPSQSPLGRGVVASELLESESKKQLFHDCDFEAELSIEYSWAGQYACLAQLIMLRYLKCLRDAH